mgnify:CR=1 FL=1
MTIDVHMQIKIILMGIIKSFFYLSWTSLIDWELLHMFEN